MILGVDNAGWGTAAGKSEGPKGNLLCSNTGQSQITREPTANRFVNLSGQACNVHIMAGIVTTILPTAAVVVVAAVKIVVAVVVVVVAIVIV
jgi:hypothetical protein